MTLYENISRVKELMGIIYESQRTKFDFNELVDKGIVWITEPYHNGKKDEPNWEFDSNVITLWNLEHPEQGQEWVFDAIKNPKKEAIGWWTEKGQQTLSDEKYRQILRSIKLKKNISESDEIKYNDPNFDLEWDEAQRYIDHPNPKKKIKWTKKDWMDKVRRGRVMKFSEIESLGNISNPDEFEDLFPEKVERFVASLAKKEIELPIVVKFPDGSYDLIAGNTRLTGLRKKGYDPSIWVFEL